MIQITDKAKCCGCTACYNICPKKAIKMVEDEEGFLYPKVDTETCIKCGVCDKVCPITQNKNKDCKDMPLKAYVVRNKDEEILTNSASGGFFSAIAKYVLRKGGCVFGAIYNEKMEVVHYGTEREDELVKFQSSKYVQSALKDTFIEVGEKLFAGKLVCFSGTPCQVAGLKNWLSKDYDNLITVDLICHGVPSPLLWREYLKYQKKKFGSEIVDSNFRNKDYGYHNGTLKLNFKNKKIHHGSSRNDIMMKCFFGEISSRPSCYQCAFKQARHISDFTIFDCWHADKLVETIENDDKGYTNLFINSAEGLEILSQLKSYLDVYETDAELAIQYDGPMVRKSAVAHPMRDRFLKEISLNGLENAVKKYIPIFTKDRLIVSTKSMLYQLGLLQIAKNIAKKLHI